MPTTPVILVVGSINMDLIIRSRRMPAPGETLMGHGFATTPGGKGANQAVAAARLGANVRMIGRVGDDTFGQRLLAGLQAENIDCQAVPATSEQPTGVAMIVVDAAGENAIVIDSGANSLVNADNDIFPNADLFVAADVVVLQLELPLPLVRAAVDQAARHRCKVILDPAPAPVSLPDELYQVDILTPNILEAEQLTGRKTGEERLDKMVVMDLVGRGAKAVVAKLGHRGSLVVAADGELERIAAYKVDIVDTTGAGDAFTGALAVAIGRGESLIGAARFANAAAALTCTKLGAQAAMPEEADVRALMSDQPLR